LRFLFQTLSNTSLSVFGDGFGKDSA
jgi:hypothetical protein